jgi:hypothetical protein
VTGAELARALEAVKMDSTTEERLQAAIAAELDRLGIVYGREVRLSRRDRPDFMVENIAIEVKIAGGFSAVVEQLQRYAAHEDVHEIVLVSSRLQLATVPRELGGKPVHVAVQMGAF